MRPAMYRLTDGPRGRSPYLYIDMILHELRSELFSAMHADLKSQWRHGQVDVDLLYRALTRGAMCATPQRISEKCVAETMTSKPS